MKTLHDVIAFMKKRDKIWCLRFETNPIVSRNFVNNQVVGFWISQTSLDISYPNETITIRSGTRYIGEYNKKLTLLNPYVFGANQYRLGPVQFCDFVWDAIDFQIPIVLSNCIPQVSVIPTEQMSYSEAHKFIKSLILSDYGKKMMRQLLQEIMQ